MTRAPVLCLSPNGTSPDVDRTEPPTPQAAADRRVYWLENSARPCRLAMLGAVRAGPITVLTPYLPRDIAAGDEPRVLGPLLQSALDADDAGVPIVWCFDAQSLPLVDRLPTGPIVYDCVRAPRGGAGRAAESAALARAQVVFTADAVQFERLRSRHRQVYLAPRRGPGGAPDSAMLSIVEGTRQGTGVHPAFEPPGAQAYRVIRGGGEERAARHPRM